MKLRLLPPLVAMALSCPQAWAEAAADDAAQEIHRQLEREKAMRQRQESRPDVRLETPAVEHGTRLPAAETPCFAVSRITLTGDQASAFQWALAAADPPGDRATGRCLGARGIELVMRRVQNAIIARGAVTTRVLAAPQDLTQGTLALTLVPGRLRAIRFTAGSSPRATAWNAVPASPGDILDLRDLEQALENFRRLPTAEAWIDIAPADGPGAAPGESDILIAWQQGIPFRFTLSADDGGSRATGRAQGSFTLSFDGWWTLNDLLYLSLNSDLSPGGGTGKGTRGHTLHYEIPYGYWLLGATASRFAYHQSVAGANQTYVYGGTSQSGEARLSRVLHRDSTGRTLGFVKAWQRSSRNAIDDTEVMVQRRRMAGWEVGLSHRKFIAEATLDANLAFRKGTGMRGALPGPEEPFGEGTARAAIITADAQLNLPFRLASQHLRYSAAWRAQWNRDPLVPQDRFSIGGRYSVRGFDGELTLAGDRGWTLRQEVGAALGDTGLEIYTGADMGAVGGRAAASLLGQRLAGAVVGLRGTHRGLSWDLFAGAPLSRPAGFHAEAFTTGFSLVWTF